MSEDFGCRVPIDRVRDGERIDLVASEADRTAIAGRLDLLSLARLEAHCVLSHRAAGIHATGRLKAALEQACIASGEPVPAYLDEAFDLQFQPEPTNAPDEEIELGGDDLDVIFHDGQAIALGEAIADTLAILIDPYPRGPNADEALREAGVLSEDRAGPFAALAALKGRMEE